MFTSQNALFGRLIASSMLFFLGLAATSAISASAQEDFSIEQTSLIPFTEHSEKRRISKFSSMPVPRYASLKYGSVNGRQGPSLDYPVRWKYERSGLPVLVIRESGIWRKIRDPQGDEVWVHQRMLGARRTGITSNSILMFQKPDESSAPVAEVAMGVITEIAECEGDWCRINIDGRRGWMHRNAIWGVDDLG